MHKTRFWCIEAAAASATPMRPVNAANQLSAALRRLAFLLCAGTVLGLLQGCAALPGTGMAQRIDALLPADIILIGEQHDAPDHQALQLSAVTELARRGSLAALAIEMAEQGRSTWGLSPSATESQVRDALAWAEAGWSWTHYGPVLMAAVRAGVPVLGANLPRSAMRSAMATESWDQRLAPEALAQQRDDIRSGHCGLLPAGQIAPMARIQIARDAAMAETLEARVQHGKSLLLIAGAGHVVRETGVPAHLPDGLEIRIVLQIAGTGAEPQRNLADQLWRTAAIPFKDHCAALQRTLAKP